MIGDTWSLTACMRTLKYFSEDVAKHKERVHELDFIGAFLQAKFKNRVFVKLNIRYIDYLSEHAKYFGRALRLLMLMYGMTNSEKLFYDELTKWFIEAEFIQSKFQKSIYYKYATYGSKMVVLSYVDDCVYWYTNEDIGKWSVDTSGKKFHVNFLGYAHWFMSIRTSQLTDLSISVEKANYDTYIVAKYLDTATVKVGKTFYKATFPDDMIFIKEDVSTSDEQVES